MSLFQGEWAVRDWKVWGGERKKWTCFAFPGVVTFPQSCLAQEKGETIFLENGSMPGRKRKGAA